MKIYRIEITKNMLGKMSQKDRVLFIPRLDNTFRRMPTSALSVLPPEDSHLIPGLSPS
jgi:hypothetical protein